MSLLNNLWKPPGCSDVEVYYTVCRYSVTSLLDVVWRPVMAWVHFSRASTLSPFSISVYYYWAGTIKRKNGFISTRAALPLEKYLYDSIFLKCMRPLYFTNDIWQCWSRAMKLSYFIINSLISYFKCQHSWRILSVDLNFNLLWDVLVSWLILLCFIH